MKQIYMDNGSTSFPKPPEVIEAITRFVTEIGCNVNRGSYNTAYNAAETILETREMLNEMFHGFGPKNVVFTTNVTYALNVLIKGLLKPGDHVLVSSVEHNAVMRPIVQLSKKGVEFDRIPCDHQGELIVDAIPTMIKKNTKAIIMTHASNVCGTILPIEKVGKICREKGLFFIVDSAQSAGVVPIDMQSMCIDALAFTGHKSLLGPQGIGGFIISDSLANKVDPLVSGGTGSISDSEEVPTFLPDRFEPGTMNLPGIFGLNAALHYLQDYGMDQIYREEMGLTSHFLAGLKGLEDKLEIVGRHDTKNRTAVVSVNMKQKDNAEVAFLLDQQYRIMTRVGMHCAPSAHKTLGTFPSGTIRFAFNHFNTMEEIDFALKALEALA